MAVMNIGADVSPAGLSAFDQAIMSAATPTAATAGSGGGFLTNLGNLGDAVGGFLGGTGGQLIGAGLSLDALNEARQMAAATLPQFVDIAREAQEGTAFRPFTVSTGFGGIQATPEGGFTTSLSPAQAAQQQQLQAITSGLLGGMGGMGGGEAPNRFSYGPVPLPPMTAFQTSMSPEEAMAARALGQQPSQAPMAPATGGFGAGTPDVSGIQQQALGGVGGFLTGAMAPMGAREADVYERIRATQRPEEQRAQLALEERLAAQGRTGLRTAQFGGSPEQLALAQAQEEAKARASLGALGQAQAEQMQQAGLAQSMFGLGSGAAALPASLQQGQLGNIGAALGLQYLPEQQLLASLNPAVNLANIASLGQREGAGLMSEARAAGLENILQTEAARTNALQNIYGSILGAQSAQQQAAGQQATNTGLFSSIGNIGTALIDLFR